MQPTLPYARIRDQLISGLSDTEMDASKIEVKSLFFKDKVQRKDDIILQILRSISCKNKQNIQNTEIETKTVKYKQNNERPNVV